MKRFLNRQTLNPAFKRFQLLPELRRGSSVGTLSYDLCPAPEAAPLLIAPLPLGGSPGPAQKDAGDNTVALSS